MGDPALSPIDRSKRVMHAEWCGSVGIHVRIVLIATLTALVLLWLLFTAIIDNGRLSSRFDGPVTFRNERDNEFQGWGFVNHEQRIVNTKKLLASIRHDLLIAAKQLKKQNLLYETLTKQLTDKQGELRALQLDIEEAELYQKELQNRNQVRLFLPLASKVHQTSLQFDSVPTTDINAFEAVFDFSKCSIAGGFRIYVYPIPTDASKHISVYYKQLRNLRSVTENPEKACILIAVVRNHDDVAALDFWNDGANHVLLNVGDEPLPNYSRSIVVSSEFNLRTFKINFDVILHLKMPEYDKNEWLQMPSLLPLARNFLLSYVGPTPLQAPSLKKQLILLAQSAISTDDKFVFDFNCIGDQCTEKRIRLFKESTFALLFVPEDKYSSTDFHEQLISALFCGAIPVIASLRAPLPIANLIDWRRAVYTIPWQRLPELHFILRSIAPVDILAMRRQGRFLLQNYLINSKVLTETVIAVLRQRIGVPSQEPDGVELMPLFGDKLTPMNFSPAKPPQFEEEYIGPREAPHDSPSYTHNFTSMQMYSNHIWNDFGKVMGGSLEYLPIEPPFPSDFELSEGINWGFRPIEPGSGVTFSVALGSNRPREQFTVVLLTYDRIGVLSAAIERLNNLPYLNKVIVVWNGREGPPADHVWPRIHVPVLFHNASDNSLNNRLKPYSEIKTEAVLSLDDDIDLRQHEIIFAFRVWREQRTKIVGFPARYHAHYNGSLFYNSNHTCQHSMILTGAAFIHKAYLYAYTYGMPEVIREKVDELKNCEDLAMNFLVAHITRQPPIKTTSKWTFSCPYCKASLFRRPTHYTDRDECVRFFTKVYGYNPLLFTQFRVDSVLFKTRLPPEHQKCFKYV